MSHSWSPRADSSIPTMGASGLGYELAQQFGHTLIATDASLVPFTFTDKTGELIRSLAGISLPVIASNERISFKLPMLFTHRGAVRPCYATTYQTIRHTGETISINLLPNIDMTALLLAHKKSHPKQLIRTVVSDYTDSVDDSNKLPKKLLAALQTHLWDDIKDTELANIKDDRLTELGATLNGWQLKNSWYRRLSYR